MSAVWDVACPKCSAPPGSRCRTLKTGRVTDTHVERVQHAWGVA